MEGSSSRSQPAAVAGDWRSHLMPEARLRVVNKIMDILKRHLPVSSPEDLLKLTKMAVQFEEKIFTAATSRSEYLRKISLKMLSMETRAQPTAGNLSPAESADVGIRPSTPPLLNYSSHRDFQTAEQDDMV